MICLPFVFDENNDFKSVVSVCKPNISDGKRLKFPVGKKSFGASVSKSECRNCRKGQHLLIECADFLSQLPHERYSTVKKLGFCFSCFSNKHLNLECHHLPRKECSQKYHTLLHFPSKKST